MTELARITCYNDLVEAFATRKAELQLSDATLDDVAGLTPGHTGKVLGPSRDKGLGPVVLEAYLMVLAVDLVMVENETKLAEMRRHHEGRKTSHTRTTHPIGKVVVSRGMRELGRKLAAHTSQRLGSTKEQQKAGWKAWSKRLNAKRARKLTAEQRREIARAAARVRWDRTKKVKIDAS